jgi:riboflavin synthase
MFTGIITAVGRITNVESLGDSASHGKRLIVETPADYLSDVQIGESIAINGACMTVTSMGASHFTVDVSLESLEHTAGLDKIGPVNLEKALRASDRLGGHIVSGHVDDIGHVVRFEPVGESFLLAIRAPATVARYLAFKGSITVSGVSLTVNRVIDNPDGSTQIHINLIPHTLQNTALHSLNIGSPVNLEIDLIARYVERMLSITGTEDVPATPVFRA